MTAVPAPVAPTAEAPARQPVDTIAKLQAVCDVVFLLADRGVVKTVCATVIANKLDLDPVWLFLVAPSSGGKTEMINAIEGLDFVHPIDTMTVNTFASGQKRAGKETSLLLKINDGVITYKDFTAILDMNKDARKEIMGQLRCIFDGRFVKRTGTGDDIVWKGKLGFVAAITSIIHERSSEFSAMGERFIQYAIKQPNRLDVARRVFANARGMDDKRQTVADAFQEYITYVLGRLSREEVVLTEQTRDEILEVANFSTLSRSAVVKDERNPVRVRFVPDPEMPMRVTGQLVTLATTFAAMNKAEAPEGAPDQADITDDDRALVYKIALDSIPRKRRIALQVLAKFSKGATTAGIASLVGYHTEVIKETLFELAALGLVTRSRNGGVDNWNIAPEFAGTVARFEKITPVEEALKAKDEDEDFSEADQADSAKYFNDDF